MSNYRKSFGKDSPDDYENCPKFLAQYLHNWLNVFESQKSSSVMDTSLCLREYCQFLCFIRLHPDQEPDKAIKLLRVEALDISIVAGVTRPDIDRYLDFLVSVLGNSGGTVNKKVVYLRKFYAYLMDNSTDLGIQFPNGNPFAQIRSSTLPTPRAEVLTTSEIQQLLSAISPGATGLRDRAMILMLVTTSLTISEMLALDRDHVHFGADKEPSYVTVRRHGRKVDIPLYTACAAALQAYIISTDDLLTGWEKPLFLSTQKTERITERGVQKRIRVIAGHAGLTKPITTPVLRNTAVFNYLQGVPANAEALLADGLGYNSEAPLRRVSAGILAQAAADSPLNKKLEVN